MGFSDDLSAFNARHAAAPVRRAGNRSGELKLALAGELDMIASSDLAPLLDSALQECPAQGRFLLDLSRVTYIASMGVGLLANLLVKAQVRRISLVLVDIPPRVCKILEVLGLLTFFTVESCGDE